MKTINLCMKWLAIALPLLFALPTVCVANDLSDQEIQQILQAGGLTSVELKTDLYSLQFDHTGTPEHLLRVGAAENHINTHRPGNGFQFHLQQNGQRTIESATQLARSGDVLVAHHPDVTVVFAIAEKNDYLTLDLNQVIERNGSRLLEVRCEVLSSLPITFWSLDVMSRPHEHGTRYSIH
ncbi:MAG: hypothetical protein AAF456_20540, partial [Planctomycetota bacterium]